MRLPGARPEPDRDDWTCQSCQAANEASALVCHACEGRLPVIALFTATSQSDSSKEEYVLKWEVFEADSVLINPGNIIVPTQGTISLNPEWQESDLFTISASNGIGVRQLTTRVSVSPPRIHSFMVAESEIIVGHPTILYWEVENATELELSMGIGDVSGKSFTEVYLDQGGTYTLTAANTAGTVKASVELSLGLPEILNFYAGSDELKLGSPLQLFWEVNNAKHIFLDPIGEDVSDHTQIELYPEQSTTYVIRAVNATGEVSQEIPLLLPPPRILHFGAETNISTEGEPIELSWEVDNASELSIDHGIGEVGPQGMVRVKPKQAYTTYTLSVTGPSGTTSQIFDVLRFPIPLEEPELLESPKIQAMLKKNDNQIPDSLADLERLEKQVQQATDRRIREMRIQRAKEMNLSDDMLKLEKANVREELRGILLKLKSIFTISKT